MLANTCKVLGGFVVTGMLMVAGAGWAAGNAGPVQPGDTATMLQEAVAGSWRSAANKARDPYRHPVQTLEFFGYPDPSVGCVRVMAKAKPRARVETVLTHRFARRCPM